MKLLKSITLLLLTALYFSSPLWADKILPCPRELKPLSKELQEAVAGKVEGKALETILNKYRKLMWLSEQAKAVDSAKPEDFLLLQALDGFFETYLLAEKWNYDFQTALIAERYAPNQDAIEAARSHRLYIAQGKSMATEQLERRLQIINGDILDILKERNSKFLDGWKMEAASPLQPSAQTPVIADDLIASLIGRARDQVRAAVRKDLTIEVVKTNPKSFEVLSRTAKEVKTGEKKDPVSFSAEKKTAEQIVEEIFQSAKVDETTARLYIVEKGTTRRSWSYDSVTGIKADSSGELIDLLGIGF